MARAAWRDPVFHRGLHLTKEDTFSTTGTDSLTSESSPSSYTSSPNSIPNYILLPSTEDNTTTPNHIETEEELPELIPKNNNFIPPLSTSYTPIPYTPSTEHKTTNPLITKIPDPKPLNFTPDLHKHWGDIPKTDYLTNSYIFRFLHYNTQGVKPTTEPEQLKTDLKIIKNLKPTFTGINELNFNTTKPTLTRAFTNRVHSVLGKNTTIQLTSSPESSKKEFKMGGIALLTNGQFATTVFDRGNDGGG